MLENTKKSKFLVLGFLVFLIFVSLLPSLVHAKKCKKCSRQTRYKTCNPCDNCDWTGTTCVDKSASVPTPLPTLPMSPDIAKLADGELVEAKSVNEKFIGNVDPSNCSDASGGSDDENSCENVYLKVEDFYIDNSGNKNSDGNNVPEYGGACTVGSACEPGRIQGLAGTQSPFYFAIPPRVAPTTFKLCLVPGEYELTYNSDEYGDESSVCVTQSTMMSGCETLDIPSLTPSKLVRAKFNVIKKPAISVYDSMDVWGKMEIEPGTSVLLGIQVEHKNENEKLKVDIVYSPAPEHAYFETPEGEVKREKIEIEGTQAEVNKYLERLVFGTNTTKSVPSLKISVNVLDTKGEKMSWETPVKFIPSLCGNRNTIVVGSSGTVRAANNLASVSKSSEFPRYCEYTFKQANILEILDLDLNCGDSYLRILNGETGEAGPRFCKLRQLKQFPGLWGENGAIYSPDKKLSVLLKLGESAKVKAPVFSALYSKDVSTHPGNKCVHGFQVAPTRTVEFSFPPLPDSGGQTINEVFGVGVPLNKALKAPLRWAISVSGVSSNNHACNAEAEGLALVKDTVAIVTDEECTIATKVENLAKNGAVGVIFAMDLSEPQGEYGSGTTWFGLPVFQTSYNLADALGFQAARLPAAEITITPKVIAQDNIACVCLPGWKGETCDQTTYANGVSCSEPCVKGSESCCKYIKNPVDHVWALATPNRIAYFDAQAGEFGGLLELMCDQVSLDGSSDNSLENACFGFTSAAGFDFLDNGKIIVTMEEESSLYGVYVFPPEKRLLRSMAEPFGKTEDDRKRLDGASNVRLHRESGLVYVAVPGQILRYSQSGDYVDTWFTGAFNQIYDFAFGPVLNYTLTICSGEEVLSPEQGSSSWQTKYVFANETTCSAFNETTQTVERKFLGCKGKETKAAPVVYFSYNGGINAYHPSIEYRFKISGDYSWMNDVVKVHLGPEVFQTVITSRDTGGNGGHSVVEFDGTVWGFDVFQDGSIVVNVEDDSGLINDNLSRYSPPGFLNAADKTFEGLTTAEVKALHRASLMYNLQSGGINNDFHGVRVSPSGFVFATDYSGFQKTMVWGEYGLPLLGELGPQMGYMTGGAGLAFRPGVSSTHTKLATVISSTNVAGAPIQFEILLRDIFDKPWGSDLSNYYTETKDLFTISIEASDEGRAFTFSGDLLEGKDGSVVIGRFTPTTAARHTVHIKTVYEGGQHIKGSPFTVDVVPSELDSSTTIVSGDGLIRCEAGKSCSVKIVSKDAYMNTRSQGGDKFALTMMSLGTGENVELETNLKDNGDGSYEFTYLPVASGQHKIELSHNGKRISSEFLSTIAPGAIDYASTTAEGGGLEYYVEGEDRIIRVFPRDRFGNLAPQSADTAVRIQLPRGDFVQATPSSEGSWFEAVFNVDVEESDVKYKDFDVRVLLSVDKGATYNDINGSPFVVPSLRVRVEPKPFLRNLFLAFFGVAIMIDLLLIIFVYRYKTLVIMKMSQFRMLVAMFIGGICASIAGIFVSIGPIYSIPCLFAPIFGHTAFALTYGSLFLKMWRIHKIINSKAFKKTSIKDSALFIRLGLLLFIVWAYLLVWFIIDMPVLTDIIGPVKTVEGRDVQSVYRICQCKNKNTFSAGILGLEAVLLLAGVYLCVATRDLSDAISEKKEVGLGIYNTFFIGALALGIMYGFPSGDSDPELIEFLLPVIAILFSSQLSILLLMMRKLIIVLSNKDLDISSVLGSPTPATHTRDAQQSTVEMVAGMATVPRSAGKRGSQTGSTHSSQDKKADRRGSALQSLGFKGNGTRGSGTSTRGSDPSNSNNV